MTKTKVNTLDKILELVCNYYQVSIFAVKGKTRKRELVKARQVYMYFAKLYTKHTTTEISEQILRDHATTLHGVKVITFELTYDADLRLDINVLKKQVLALFNSVQTEKFNNYTQITYYNQSFLNKF